MAANIDQSTGKAAFISYQQPPWWGLENSELITQSVLSAEEALRKAHLNFIVKKAPNIHRLPTGDVVSNKSFFTYRTDVNKILGHNLGRGYTVMQNHEAFNIVDEILESGTASIETAGALNNGATVFICMKINKDVIVNGNDITKQYVLIVTSHDGSKPVMVFFTNVRVVCANTLAAALTEAKNQHVRIMHTTNVVSRVREAAKVLKLIKENNEANEIAYNTMAATRIKQEQMWDYFGNLFLDESDIAQLKAGKSSKEVVSSRKRNVLNAVHSYALSGPGQPQTLDHGNLTMWTAYNAVTGYLTGKKYSSVDDRADSLLFGTSAGLIKSAGLLAMSPDKITPLYSKKLDINLN